MSDSPRLVSMMSAFTQRPLLRTALTLACAMALPVCGAAALAHHATQAHVASARPHAVATHTSMHGRPVGQHAPVRASGTRSARAAHPPVSTMVRAKDSRNAAIRPVLVRPRALAPTAPVPVDQTAQARQQQRVEDRVHAWYRAQHPQATPANQTAGGSTANAAVQGPLEASKAPVTQAAAPVIRLSPAALQTDEAMHASAAAQPSATSGDDSVALAEESHIPSTAPTERTAAPFTHGDFTLTGPNTAPAAPVLRASSPAASALLAGKPHVDSIPVEVASQPGTFTVTPALTPAPVRPSPAEQDAANAASLVKVTLYDTAGKLILIPPMKGTHDILVHQNRMAEADGLQRISSDAQLAEMRRSHLLVALPETAGIGVDERMPLNRRYARPWSVHFLNDLARAHYAWFHTPLIVTSAARTVAFQRHLVMVNGNAAPPTGDIASPHLYGQAVDIAKHSMSTAELAWMRAYLTPLEAQGKIDVEEEFQQACFHISIYRSYGGSTDPQPEPKKEVPRAYTVQQAKAAPARRRHVPTALLAMRLR